MTKEPFVIERTYNASIEKVWSALTHKDQMKQWYFDLAEFKPEAGFEFSFRGGKDERTYLPLCKITDVVQGNKLAYSWKYEGYEGSSIVIFELVTEEAGTRLQLTHEGFETFPANNPDFAKENLAAAWNYIIGTSLEKVLRNA
jgi:uncharacterized protein YndB with AHSA1/START domain